MSPHQNFKLQQLGFSLVEIMVGMVISLLSMIIILQVFSAFEGQKRTSTSGSDAQTNGSIALFTIERDLRNAGYGFSVPEALGCTIKSYYNGAPLPAFSLQPVLITNGAGGSPDTIQMLASGKGGWSIPAKITSSLPPTAAPFDLNTTLGIEVNDLMIAFEPGVASCTILQVTNIPPGASKIDHQGGANSLWNPTGIDATNLYPPGGYTNNAMLFNLGQMIRHTYEMDNASNNLLFTEFVTASGAAATAVPLIPDIVNLQAEYGFDARVGPQTTAQVTAWDGAMIDADGNGVVGDAGDVARIYAVRIAVVARSGQQEREVDPITLACNTTTTKPKFFDTNTDIEISKNPDDSANANWMCYRYKTFQTIIPLRNLIWRQT